MKFQLFAFVLVVAGAYAMPSASDVAVVDSTNQQNPTIIIDDIIRRIIQLISTGIKNVGLDPLVIKKIDLKLPTIPHVFTAKAYLHNLEFDGASNIKIHTLDYSVLLNKLTFDISLPQLSLAVGGSGAEVVVFKKKIDEQLNGSYIIESIRLSGEICVSVGVINHVDLRRVSLNFTLGDVKSNLNVSALGKDYSDLINHILSDIIPDAIKSYENVINKFLEDIVKAIFHFINIIF